MALQKAFTDNKTDVSLPNAYHRIDGLNCNLVPTRNGAIIIGVYATAASRNASKQPLRSIPFELGVVATTSIFCLPDADEGGTPSPGIPLRKAYLYLRTLVEYAGATDV